MWPDIYIQLKGKMAREMKPPQTQDQPFDGLLAGLTLPGPHIINYSHNTDHYCCLGAVTRLGFGLASGLVSSQCQQCNTSFEVKLKNLYL